MDLPLLAGLITGVVKYEFVPPGWASREDGLFFPGVTKGLPNKDTEGLL